MLASISVESKLAIESNSRSNNWRSAASVIRLGEAEASAVPPHSATSADSRPCSRLLDRRIGMPIGVFHMAIYTDEWSTHTHTHTFCSPEFLIKGNVVRET